MSGSDPGFESRLLNALNQLGLTADAPRAVQMLDYLAQLQHWNQAYNLTAVRDPSRMLVQHVFDSLAVVPALRAYARGRNLRVADIGSGAGLPGIIVAICEPRWSVACVDAVGKKTAFVRQAAGVLGLTQVRAVQARAETIESLRADIVISRAFASLGNFVKVAAHHLAADGHLLAMKGQFPQSEQAELESTSDWRVLHRMTLEVPEMDAHRCLLELAPKEPNE